MGTMATFVTISVELVVLERNAIKPGDLVPVWWDIINVDVLSSVPVTVMTDVIRTVDVVSSVKKVTMGINASTNVTRTAGLAVIRALLSVMAVLMENEAICVTRTVQTNASRSSVNS